MKQTVHNKHKLLRNNSSESDSVDDTSSVDPSSVSGGAGRVGVGAGEAAEAPSPAPSGEATTTVGSGDNTAESTEKGAAEEEKTRASLEALTLSLNRVVEMQRGRHKHLQLAVPLLMSVLDDIGLAPEVSSTHW
eukprot:1911733-Pyramimonas_sp.AAC.1